MTNHGISPTATGKKVADPRPGGTGQIEPEFLGIADAIRFSGVGRTSIFEMIRGVF